jgi:hypothetical protein
MAAFLEVEFTVTLMRLTPSGDYVESGDRMFNYYFAVPDAWASLPDQALQSRAFAAAGRMYADTNQRLRAAEPSDPNYLHVKSTRTRVLPPDEASSWPWISANPPVWEPSACFVVHGDGSYDRVNPLELGNAVPAERDRVRLDRVLPGLVSKNLPACSAVYAQLYDQFHDPRPLDERSRTVWGMAVLFLVVLDRLATGGEYPDPFGTLDRMISWLAEGGEAAREDVTGAQQIYRKMLEYHIYRPNAPLHDFIYERAWFVRYSDLEMGKPSAFQGFIHCLASCRETLGRFEFDDPFAAAAAPRSRIYEKIDAFNKTALLPAFDEIRATLERHGKRVVVAEDDQLGDEFLESLYHEIYPSPRFARELATGTPSDEDIAAGRARFLGHTLVAIDPEQPGESPYAGKYFETVVFVVGPNETVAASPFVVYHMRFDDKLHGFDHRFDKDQASQPVETVDKYAVQNHFLGAYDFFKIHARSAERPW